MPKSTLKLLETSVPSWSVSSPSQLHRRSLGTSCVLKNLKFIMADDREGENGKINVVVKTSKNKETIETEATATILKVISCNW